MLIEEKDAKKLKKIAYTACGGIDEYYEERTALLSDIQFFNLFMKREKKSSFNFRVAVDQNFCTLFTDLWRRWGFFSDSEEIIETVLVEYLCLKKLIEDVLAEVSHHKNEEMLSEEEMAYLISYFERFDDFSVSDYVIPFIQCASVCTVAQERIKELRNLGVQKEIKEEGEN